MFVCIHVGTHLQRLNQKGNSFQPNLHKTSILDQYTVDLHVREVIWNICLITLMVRYFISNLNFLVFLWIHIQKILNLLQRRYFIFY